MSDMGLARDGNGMERAEEKHVRGGNMGDKGERKRRKIDW